MTAPARMTGGMTEAIPGATTDPAHLEKARTLAKEDAVAGLRWLFASGLIVESKGDSPDCLRAFVGALPKDKPLLDLADLIESPQVRAVYQSAAYDTLARQDPALAWRLWSERAPGHADEPVVPIFLREFRTSGLKEAWQNLLRHRSGAVIAPSDFSVICQAAEFRDEDAAQAIRLLQEMPDGAGDVLLEDPRAVAALARHAPARLGEWLDALPADSQRDHAYAAMAWHCAARQDFRAAQTWLERIHNEGKREETLAHVRNQMSSTPVGTKVE